MAMAMGRIMAAAVLAFLALTVFCYFYDNMPPSQPAEGGASDYTHLANAFVSVGTEGFSWNRSNNEGYTNAVDYTPGMDIDVLIMGSSNVEGYHVGMKENMTYALQEKLPGKTVYNVGISAHYFLTCAANLPAAIKKYHPKEYVVLETSTVLFDRQELEDAIAGKTQEVFTEQSRARSELYQEFPLLATLRLVPKMLIANLKNWIKTGPASPEQETRPQNDEVLLDKVLTDISREGEAGGVGIIVLYHPNTKLLPDGSIVSTESRAETEQFQALCEKNGIRFLNMGERFLTEYTQNHVLPYGFSNSSVGSGHLNKYGHAMIADELCKIMEGAA